MHDVTCDKCGNECQVPFKPSGGKPVLCSDCYRNSGNDRSSPRSSGAPSISPEQFKQINEKLDKILKILSDLEIADEDDLEDDEEEDSEDNEELGKEEPKKESKESKE